MIHELGDLLADLGRFEHEPELICADVDLAVSARRGCASAPSTIAPARRPSGDEVPPHRLRASSPISPMSASSARSAASRSCPPIPRSSTTIATKPSTSRSRGCQAHHRDAAKTLVIGISGGLDSTHALIVAAKAMRPARPPRSAILGFTMPGFATGDETKANAWALMKALGITGAEIDIRPAARQMLADMDHPFAKASRSMT
jgi:NAD+ synthase (glutamine-hydrolysing)